MTRSTALCCLGSFGRLATSFVVCCFAIVLLSSCNRIQEAYHGEKTLQNTAWGHFDEETHSAKWFVVFYSYDQGCEVCINGSDGKQCKYKGLYVFDESNHSVEIRPVVDEDTPENIPSELKGTVDATGLTLKWNFSHAGDPDILWSSALFTYICPADELG